MDFEKLSPAPESRENAELLPKDPALKDIVQKFHRLPKSGSKSQSPEVKTQAKALLSKAYMRLDEIRRGGGTCDPRDAHLIREMTQHDSFSRFDDNGGDQFAQFVEKKVTPRALEFYFKRLEDMVKKPVLTDEEQIASLSDINTLLEQYGAGKDNNALGWIVHFADKLLANPSVKPRRKSVLTVSKFQAQKALGQLERHASPKLEVRLMKLEAIARKPVLTEDEQVEVIRDVTDLSDSATSNMDSQAIRKIVTILENLIANGSVKERRRSVFKSLKISVGRLLNQAQGH